MGNNLTSPRSKKNIIDIIENINDETIKKLFNTYDKDLDGHFTKEEFENITNTIQNHIKELEKKEKTIETDIELKYFKKISVFEKLDMRKEDKITADILKEFYSHNYLSKDLYKAEEMIIKKNYKNAKVLYESFFENTKQTITKRELFKYAMIHYKEFDETNFQKEETKSMKEKQIMEKEICEEKLKMVESIIPYFEKCLFNNDILDSLIFAIHEKLIQLNFQKFMLQSKISNDSGTIIQ
jgi:hypothetical protein